MRFRLPSDCAGVVLGGLALLRDADGTIEAEEGAADALAPHDILPADAADAVDTTSEHVRRKSTRGRGEDRRMLR